MVYASLLYGAVRYCTVSPEVSPAPPLSGAPGVSLSTFWAPHPTREFGTHLVIETNSDNYY